MIELICDHHMFVRNIMVSSLLFDHVICDDWVKEYRFDHRLLHLTINFFDNLSF